MRRSIFIILSFFILISAVASDAQRARRTRTTAKRAATTKAKPKAKKAPPVKINTDSIEAANLMQRRADSLNTLASRTSEGDVAALNQLATWYYNGHIVSQDYNMAVDLWRSAADKSDVRAMANLGLCYRLGHGVPQSDDEAARLYGKSIREGNGALFKQCIDSSANDVFSAILIGNCYQHGDGVKKDVAKAADFYAKAAAQGSVQGMREAALCYMQSNDSVEAFTYFEMGAANADPICQYWAGEMMLDDDADLESAVALIRQAAESNVPEAQNRLGELYAEGRGVDHDDNKALQLYRHAADQKCIDGMWNYASALINGMGVATDFSEATALMSDAFAMMNQENMTAMPFEMTELYRQYFDGMRLLLIDKDLMAANNIFKALDKAKVPEGKIMQALILASDANPKANPKKAAKMLGSLAASNPQAAYYLKLINASNVPVAVNVAKAVTGYFGSDNIMSLLADFDQPIDTADEPTD